MRGPRYCIEHERYEPGADPAPTWMAGDPGDVATRLGLTVAEVEDAVARERALGGGAVGR
jgi:hypothetical protein